MRILRITTARPLSPRHAIIAAAILHVLLTATVFSVGRLGLFPSQINRDGIGEFARDSHEFRAQANLLADELTNGELSSWFDHSATFHVKVYSLDFVLVRPLLGTSILAAEPLNLSYYLAILTLVFSLARVVAGRRAAWLASAIVALWPSLLLHTTQFLRDPLLIAAILALTLLLTRLLKRNYEWRSAATNGVLGTLTCLVIWLCRRDMWPVIIALIVVTALLLIIRMLRERKLLAWNLAVVGFLCMLTIAVPRVMRPPMAAVAETLSALRRSRDPSFWGLLKWTREEFIAEGLHKSGSLIDADVGFSNRAEVIKYIPRALEIGYLAPFPTTWFTTGYMVGLIGRLFSGVEMSLTYGIELLAGVFFWRKRRHLDVWLLFLTTTIGALALGMVVVNLGTLYRMRYSFWILMVIMAAGTLTSFGRHEKVAATANPEVRPEQPQSD